MGRAYDATRCRYRKREAKLGFSFISPWLVGFSIFYLIPMIVSLVISFTDLNLATPDEAAFNGVDNWKRMLFDDPNTWKSLWITLRFGIISLPIWLASAFLLAVLLNSLNLVGRNIFRTLFFVLVPCAVRRRGADLVPGIERGDRLGQPDDRVVRHPRSRTGWNQVARRSNVDPRHVHIHRHLGNPQTRF